MLFELLDKIIFLQFMFKAFHQQPQSFSKIPGGIVSVLLSLLQLFTLSSSFKAQFRETPCSTVDAKLIVNEANPKKALNS